MVGFIYTSIFSIFDMDNQILTSSLYIIMYSVMLLHTVKGLCSLLVDDEPPPILYESSASAPELVSILAPNLWPPCTELQCTVPALS